MIIQFCGLSGVGKTTLAQQTKNQLLRKKIPVEIIDGDVYRSKLCRDLSFSRADRLENIRRLGFVASRFSRQGIVTIMSVINPYEETRAELVRTYPNVMTVYLRCALETLYKRDTKGLYRRALLPDHDPEKITNLTGVNDQFEVPCAADLQIDTDRKTIADCTNDLCDFIFQQLGRTDHNSLVLNKGFN